MKKRRFIICVTLERAMRSGAALDPQAEYALPKLSR